MSCILPQPPLEKDTIPLLELTVFSVLAIRFHQDESLRLNRRRTNKTIAAIRSIHVPTSHDKRNVFLFLVSNRPRILQDDITRCGTSEIVLPVF